MIVDEYVAPAFPCEILGMCRGLAFRRRSLPQREQIHLGYTCSSGSRANIVRTLQLYVALDFRSLPEAFSHEDW